MYRYIVSLSSWLVVSVVISGYAGGPVWCLWNLQRSMKSFVLSGSVGGRFCSLVWTALITACISFSGMRCLRVMVIGSNYRYLNWYQLFCCAFF